MSGQTTGKAFEERSTSLAWIQRTADELARSFSFWHRQVDNWLLEIDDCRECGPDARREYLLFLQRDKWAQRLDEAITVLAQSIHQGQIEVDRLSELACKLFDAVVRWMPDCVDVQSRSICSLGAYAASNLDAATAWWELIALEAMKRGATGSQPSEEQKPIVPANEKRAGKQTTSRPPDRRITFEMAGAVAGISKQQAHRKFKDGSGNVDSPKVVIAAYEKKLEAGRDEERDAKSAQAIAKPRVGELCKCLKLGCDWMGNATENGQCPEGHSQGIEPMSRPRHK